MVFKVNECIEIEQEAEILFFKKFFHMQSFNNAYKFIICLFLCRANTMKPVHITLIKTLLLIVLLVLTLISFFSAFISWQDLLLVQSLMGVLFVFLSCYEYLNASYKADLPVQRYPYFPYSFIMFKVLRAFAFYSFAIMLYTSGTRVKFLFPICVIIGSTELIVLLLRYLKKLCFISIYANYLLFSKNSIFKIFASEIERIEFRHDIFYIIKKNGKSEDVRLVNIADKTPFISHLISWIEKNNILVGEESKSRLAELTALISRAN